MKTFFKFVLCVRACVYVYIDEKNDFSVQWQKVCNGDVCVCVVVALANCSGYTRR